MNQPVTPSRFTERGDDTLEAEIRSALDALVRRAAPTPGLQALLLGGSLGRGEATVRTGPAGDRLASDVEVYLVGDSPGLRTAARGLERAATADGLAVSAAWLDPTALRLRRAKNLSRRPSRTIRLYELLAGSRLLWGEPPTVAPLDPRELPLAEGLRLVLNRMAEAAPELAVATADAARWWDKLLIACGDAMLLARGAYTVLYRARAERLAGQGGPWPMPDGWQPSVLAAYERKLTGAESATADRSAELPLVRATLAALSERVLAEPLEPIASYPGRFIRAAARHDDLLRYLPPVGPAASYEGLVVAARLRRSGQSLTLGGLANALLGRPMSLATQGAAVPLFFGVVGSDPELLRVARQALARAGVPRRRLADDDPAVLAGTLRDYWRDSV